MTAVLLDISRTVSRIGAGGDSGVDRVERAYIREVSTWDRPVFFLTRVLGGLALLDRAGVQVLLALADAPKALPSPDTLGHLALRQSPARRRVDTAVRQHALGWARVSRLKSLLQNRLGHGYTYLNVGHTNLDTPLLKGLRAMGCQRIVVLVHDVIPLDHPEFSRPGTPERFGKMLRGVAEMADCVIFNSAHTAARAQHWFSKWGAAPIGITALLGVDPPDAPPPTSAPGADPPSFVMLGTIEPRKNHLLILNIWRRFWAQMKSPPHLHVVGRRGWENEMVLDQLDRGPFMGSCVFEHGHIADAELVKLLAQARALLFPSFAEGFGYPLAEACQIGIPALCSDLPVFREVAGDAPTYLDPLDGPGWAAAITAVAAAPPSARKPTKVPDWETHFDVVKAAV